MMVQKMTTHMGKTGIVGRSNYKFKNQPPAEKTWKKAKKWFRDSLTELRTINEEAGLQTAFSANNVTLKTAAEDQAKAEISQKLGQSFDALAMAATAKAEIHESQATAIATLTSTNATLTTTNATLTAEIKKLTAEIIRLKSQTKAPPGFETGTGGGAETAMNSAGVVCPAKKGDGRKGNVHHLYFTEKQFCKNCNAKVWHIPANCPLSMEGKKRKAEYLAKQAAAAAEACKDGS